MLTMIEELMFMLKITIVNFFVYKTHYNQFIGYIN